MNENLFKYAVFHLHPDTLSSSCCSELWNGQPAHDGGLYFFGWDEGWNLAGAACTDAGTASVGRSPTSSWTTINVGDPPLGDSGADPRQDGVL